MSVNNFFHKDISFLSEHRKWLINYLKLYNRPQSIIDVYLWAYDYCVQNPDSYDGATMTEDLAFHGLEPEAMLHDVLYVALNVAGNFKHQYIADLIIKKEMEAHKKSSIETGKRFYLLLLKIPLFVPYAYIIKNRKMSIDDKKEMQNLKELFLKDYKVNWKRELKWVAVVIIIILIVLFRVDVNNLIKLFF
ncbi:hypothetical protein FORMB_16730 [Formosa sp. Hel1_33_131]|uniref:hypothetical protein n=1 Tax=Formosa sp. Hel1_33_131 TaxID=1336794 RepID=UPI00084E219F|nr:hypothetical protein [Formosa sp. Hel1_33_131]AOR28712.1 hypothetical protein FORMB_16730 [Formosa sp. Hel1_33_131]